MVLFIIIACLMFKIQSMSLSVLNYQLEKVQGTALQFRNLCISISMIIDDSIKNHEMCIPYCILSLVKRLYITMDIMANLSIGVYIKV